jgi:glycosyltransferase involved in cell wall biosynthesis
MPTDLQESVHFTGMCKTSMNTFKHRTSLSFQRSSEAFGISLIEAMACGLPVISTGVGGVKDILQHRQNGLVVEAGDFQTLYDALGLLICDGALSARLGQAARQTAQERYSAEIITQEYVELFERMSSVTG